MQTVERFNILYYGSAQKPEKGKKERQPANLLEWLHKNLNSCRNKDENKHLADLVLRKITQLYASPKIKSELSEAIGQFFKKNEEFFSNTTFNSLPNNARLKVNGTILEVNRLRLACKSDFFARLFINGFKEQCQAGGTIELLPPHPEMASRTIQFLNTGHQEELFKPKNYAEGMSLVALQAFFLLSPRFKPQIENPLVPLLSDKKLQEIESIAKEYQLPTLYMKAALDKMLDIQMKKKNGVSLSLSKEETSLVAGYKNLERFDNPKLSLLSPSAIQKIVSPCEKTMRELFLPNSCLTTLQPLENLIRLRVLTLSHSQQLRSLGGAEFVVGVEQLNISHCEELTDIEALIKFKELKVLNICGSSNIMDVTPLFKCVKLERIIMDANYPKQALLKAALPNCTMELR